MSSYGSRGVWRKARKDHTCDYYFGYSSGGLCRAPIAAGTYYFDTLELNQASYRSTDRLCIRCARVELGQEQA